MHIYYEQCIPTTTLITRPERLFFGAVVSRAISCAHGDLSGTENIGAFTNVLDFWSVPQKTDVSDTAKTEKYGFNVSQKPLILGVYLFQGLYQFWTKILQMVFLCPETPIFRCRKFGGNCFIFRGGLVWGVLISGVRLILNQNFYRGFSLPWNTNCPIPQNQGKWLHLQRGLSLGCA